MSDISTVGARYTGADLEFFDKATGNTVLALRAGQVVDISGAASLLTPAPQSQSLTVTLSAAQINALHATPITLVAAPGAAAMVDVTNILYEFKYGSAAFATSTGDLGLYWGSGGQQIGLGNLSHTLLKGTANLLVADLPALPQTTLNGTGLTPSSALNQPVVIQNPAATEYTVGTGCILIVRINYRIISGL